MKNVEEILDQLRTKTVDEANLSSSERRMVAMRGDVSDEVLTRLSQDELVSVRMAVAANHQAPSDVLASLAADRDPRVRYAVALNDGNWVTRETFQRLQRDPDARVRVALAYNVTTLEDCLGDLGRDTDAEVRRAVAGRDDTAPNDVLVELAVDADPQVRAAVSNGIRVVAAEVCRSARELGLLAKEGDESVRAQVASNEAAPEDLLAQLAKDESLKVRMAVFNNPGTPQKVLSDVANAVIEQCMTVGQSERDWIVFGTAGGAGGAEKREAILCVALDNRVPKSDLLRLHSLSREWQCSSGDGIWTFRREIDAALAENRACPSEVAKNILNDNQGKNHKLYNDVLVQLSGNEEMDADILQQLAGDGNRFVKTALARNSNCPVRAMESLAEDKSEAVRMCVAGNPHAPERLLRRLAHDRADVRLAVAENPATPPEVVIGALSGMSAADIAECAVDEAQAANIWRRLEVAMDALDEDESAVEQIGVSR